MGSICGTPVREKNTDTGEWNANTVEKRKSTKQKVSSIYLSSNLL
jgi:hypothetical protein